MTELIYTCMTFHRLSNSVGDAMDAGCEIQARGTEDTPPAGWVDSRSAFARNRFLRHDCEACAAELKRRRAHWRHA